MTANFSYPTNATKMYQIFQYSNTVTNEWFGAVILIMLFVIIFITLKDYKTNRAFATASFITAVVAVLFKSFSIITDFTLYLFIIAAGLGLVALLVEEQEG